MKKLFDVEIGHDEEKGFYRANVLSTAERKGKTIESVSLKLVMVEVSKVVRKRASLLRKFPPPEPSRIISINGGPSNLIVPARN